MFTHSTPAPAFPGFASDAVASSPGVAASPTSGAATGSSGSSRTSRLRGLSYIRNYTQTHILSRDPSHSSQTATPISPVNASGHHSVTLQTDTIHSSSGTVSSTTTSAGPGSGPEAPTATPASVASTNNIVSATGTQHHGRAHHQNSSSLSAIHIPFISRGQSDPARLPRHSPSLSTNDATVNTNHSASVRSNRTPFSLLTSRSHSLTDGIPSASLESPTTTAPTTSVPPGTAPPSDDNGIRVAADTSDSNSSSSDNTDNNNNAATMTRARSATTSDVASRAETGGNMESLPSIRFSTFYDPRATRPSLTFSPISRTLPTGKEIIRVGRYSERDKPSAVPHNVPSAAPVGFKSKVVSRRHCEFWYEDGKWFIKDVKSSSGTFLNHIRLSPPGTESKPFPVNDGDIVQLGIDFKGGEEMIFRCVKMRLELNRGWQAKLNAFNMQTHKRLRNMTAQSSANGASQSYSQDCSICLNSIAPCQSLFVAPCSHTWHYKCIRSLLSSPSYPQFICPNCRAAADLEAEVDDPEDWEQLEADEQMEDAVYVQDESQASSNDAQARLAAATPIHQHETDASGDVTMLYSNPQQPAVSNPFDGTSRPVVSHNSTSQPVPIRQNPAAVNGPAGESRRDAARTPSPTGIAHVVAAHEGPITPRNDVGPWVFDGGSTTRTRANGEPDSASRLGSLEAAVAGAHITQGTGST
ncbi:hypothetical protein QBC32DRAFT_205756 [Pseudoneurospora amorphoporcata]|uniref:RING-type E3 ubiquitin transferase n=1 Tax=Pseudoneurospora amorphoporcata TaxID=241081 RepID=A0AAN6SJ41_9PEZI|nr:hypothetical protein QBC32DRAFT_205756 [Pseudoneurospora amorphoporcata]